MTDNTVPAVETPVEAVPTETAVELPADSEPTVESAPISISADLKALGKGFVKLADDLVTKIETVI